MGKSQIIIDMQDFDTINDRVLQYTPQSSKVGAEKISTESPRCKPAPPAEQEVEKSQPPRPA